MTVQIKLPDFGKLVADVSAEFKERVERRTPVDTGRAKANWRVQVSRTHGQISNDTPYVGFLEHGTYKMRPFHMVKLTMEEVPDIIAEALNKQRK